MIFVNLGDSLWMLLFVYEEEQEKYAMTYRLS
jgi:hypothetical protein